MCTASAIVKHNNYKLGFVHPENWFVVYENCAENIQVKFENINERFTE